MEIISGISGTSSNSFSIGDALPTNVDGYLLFATGNTNKPGVKYDTISSTVKFSNDGYVWNNVGSALSSLGGDLSGTISNASVVGFNGKALTTDVPGDGYAYVYSSSSSKFVPSKINNSSIITVGKQDLLIANATNYLLSNFTESTDENAIAFLAPIVGILSNLVCYCATAPGGSETVVITVRKNTVDTTITGTITGAGTTATDITHTASLASGDKITFKVVTSLNCVARDLFVSLIFKM